MPTGELFEAPAQPRVERESVEICALGVPRPKGSMRAFVVGKVAPRAVVTHDSNENVKLWSGLVADAARSAMDGRSMFIGRAISVTVIFTMPRPAGHYKADGKVKPSAPDYPLVKPDLDKLTRSTMDALKGIVFDEDSRIVTISAHKVYVWDGERPGAKISVHEAV